MRRRRLLLLAVAWLALARAPAASVAEPPVGPPGPDPRDVLLFARAERVGRNVAVRHVTPEGLLAYHHRRDATPAQLSADALKRADTGIWTGCYAASVACRYAVTRDPEALALARRLAAGLDLLSAATGVPGCVSRSAGRPIPGEPPGEHLKPSPLGGGLFYREDPSRDTLSGIVLGWECLARYVDDVEVRAYASRNLGAIARRLYAGHMDLKDADGETTTYGKLDAKAALLFENGMHAAIGLATIQAGRTWSPGRDLDDAWRHLGRDGWDDAVDAQWTFLNLKATSASNMNMVHLALAVLTLEAEGKAHRGARAAIREFRRKTRGWQNGAYLAVHLLSGETYDRRDVVEELRGTLSAMPPEEIPYEGGDTVEEHDVVPIEQRPVNVWAWKLDPHKRWVPGPAARPEPRDTFTRADWLFAYWLARAAGELVP